MKKSSPFMTIRGKYEPKTQTISIDLRSHLFDDSAPTTFHEVTHFYLAKYTNHGSVYSVLNEILLNPHDLTTDHRVLVGTAQILHKNGYLVHEGFAHFMQARKLLEDGSIQSVKDLEDRIPHEAKTALSYLRFAVEETNEFCNKLIGKLSRLSMNNNLPVDALAEQALILDYDRLNIYMAEKSNSPDERFKALTQAVEKDRTVLDLEDKDICERAGITYYKPLSNSERANLINCFTALTNHPTNLTEKDIKVLSGPEEFLRPAYESMSIRDANIETDAIENHVDDYYLPESKNFRTIFVFNGPETPVPVGKFGFYAFGGNHRIVNGRFNIKNTQQLLTSDRLTKVIDTHSFNYERNSIKPERKFVGANIIWYKNFIDFKVFIAMLEKLKLKVQGNYVAFTETHSYWFYIFKTDPNQNILHILASFPFVSGRLEAKKADYEIEKVNFFDLVAGNEIHMNNFYHDILGIPYQFDIIEMARDTEKNLNSAKERLRVGLSQDEPCICGSGRKYKWCHSL